MDKELDREAFDCRMAEAQPQSFNDIHNQQQALFDDASEVDPRCFQRSNLESAFSADSSPDSVSAFANRVAVSTDFTNVVVFRSSHLIDRMAIRSDFRVIRKTSNNLFMNKRAKSNLFRVLGLVVTSCRHQVHSKPRRCRSE